MTVVRVELTGNARWGLEPGFRALDEREALPQEVCLGRIRPKAHPAVLRLTNYLTSDQMSTPPPTATHWRVKASEALGRMYLNDRYGDCVIAGKAHALGIWSANDSDSGGTILASDNEILQQYQAICGPGDQGCVITNVLDVMRARGFLAGGKLHVIDGYVAVDWTNKLEVQVSIALFAACTIGINLPQAWLNSATWDVTESPIVGGHDVTPLDYDAQGVYVSSWGRLYCITWPAFLSRRWLEEMYVILAPAWYGNDKLAASGVNVATLQDDLAKLANGIIPDPAPQPPEPPEPPGPPLPPTPEALFTLRWKRASAKGEFVSFYAPVRIPAGRYAVIPLANSPVIANNLSD